MIKSRFCSMIPKWSFTYFQVQDNAMNYFHLLANHVPPSNPLKSLAMRMRGCSLPGWTWSRRPRLSVSGDGHRHSSPSTDAPRRPPAFLTLDFFDVEWKREAVVGVTSMITRVVRDSAVLAVSTAAQFFTSNVRVRSMAQA